MKMFTNYVNNNVCKPEITKYFEKAKRKKLCVTDKYAKHRLPTLTHLYK